MLGGVGAPAGWVSRMGMVMRTCVGAWGGVGWGVGGKMAATRLCACCISIPRSAPPSPAGGQRAHLLLRHAVRRHGEAWEHLWRLHEALIQVLEQVAVRGRRGGGEGRFAGQGNACRAGDAGHAVCRGRPQGACLNGRQRRPPSWRVARARTWYRRQVLACGVCTPLHPAARHTTLPFRPSPPPSPAHPPHLAASLLSRSSTMCPPYRISPKM